MILLNIADTCTPQLIVFFIFFIFFVILFHFFFHFVLFHFPGFRYPREKKYKSLQATIHDIQNDIACFSELYITIAFSAIFSFPFNSVYLKFSHVITLVKKKKNCIRILHALSLFPFASYSLFSKMMLSCNFQQS